MMKMISASRSGIYAAVSEPKQIKPNLSAQEYEFTDCDVSTPGEVSDDVE